MKRGFLPVITDFIHRPRIDRLIDAGLKNALMLVLAGPGYGKTLSVAHYMKSAEARLIWLRISSHRTGTADIWDDLVKAAGDEMPGYAKTLQDIAFPENTTGLDQFLSATAAAADAGKRVVLVVDNYERISDDRLIRFFDRLIDNTLPNFTLVILCNVMMPFASILPEAGQFRITDKDLAFNNDEIKIMYDHYGIESNREMIARAYEVTGGWPLGLRLVCESNPQNPKNYSSSTPLQIAADLFEQHYFRKYPEDVQTQLTLFSLLPQFSLEMIRHKTVTPRNRYGHLLMQSPFVSYDYGAGLFMFQPMYHDFLRQKQAHLSQEARSETMGHAGRWFAEHGMPYDAMDCFWGAADYAGYLQTIMELPKMRKTISQTNPILKRLEQIPRSYADKNPVVDFIMAYMHLNAAKSEKARDLLLEVEERILQEPDAAGNRQLLGTLYATLADIATFHNEDTGLAWIKKAYDLLPDGSSAHSPELMVLGNNSSFYLARDDRPGELERMVGHRFEFGKYAYKVERGSGHGYDYLFAGEAAILREEMDRAAAMLNSAIVKAQGTGQHDIILNALWCLGRIELYYANHKNAFALLHEIETYVDENNLVTMRELRDCAAAYFYIWVGDLDKVPAWFSEPLTGPEEMPLSFGRKLLIKANYLLVRGDLNQAYAVMVELETQLNHKGRWYEKVCLHIFMAHYHLANGDKTGVEKEFRITYDMLYTNDLKLPLSEYGKEMMNIIDIVRKADTGYYDLQWLDEVCRDALSYAKRFSMMRKSYSGEIYSSLRSSLVLTKRENETLHYLAQGLTQQEMGKLMGISASAVKKHISKIYHKFGAVNRADAIHIASIDGLVDVLNT